MNKLVRTLFLEIDKEVLKSLDVAGIYLEECNIKWGEW